MKKALTFLPFIYICNELCLVVLQLSENNGARVAMWWNLLLLFNYMRLPIGSGFSWYFKKYQKNLYLLMMEEHSKWETETQCLYQRVNWWSGLKHIRYATRKRKWIFLCLCVCVCVWGNPETLVFFSSLRCSRSHGVSEEPWWLWGGGGGIQQLWVRVDYVHRRRLPWKWSFICCCRWR